jgi:hypothetical protein
LRFNDATGFEVIFEARGVERGGHDENLEVRPFLFLQIESASEGDVAVEMALVEFIEDECGDAGKLWVVNDLAEKDAFSNESDAGLRAGDVFETDLVAHFAPEFGFAFEGDASREQASGEPARLQNDNLAIAKQTVVEEHLRHLSGFAGAGRRGDDNSAVGADAGKKFGFNFVNGQTIHCQQV